jgi:SulP family sulfate permease
MSANNRPANAESQTLVRGITAGLVVGVIVVTVSISLATLIFAGDLASFIPRGIGLFLFGSMVMGIVIAILSSLPGATIVPQDGPSALVAVGAAGIASAMAGVANPEGVYATVVMAIILSSLTTGAFFYLIGQFKLGNLVRFIPYPVIGGFLAGTGWLIVRGAFEGMTGLPLGLSAIPALFQADMLMRWLPGLLFAVGVLLILRSVSHFLVWPAIVVGGILLFYGIIAGLGLSIEEARAQGMLMQPFPAGGLWRPFLPSQWSAVDWFTLWSQTDKFIVIPIVAVIAFLLNASALELVAERDMDLNRELRVAGLTNLLAGLSGAPAGYHMLGGTSLALRMGAKTRVVSLTVAALCALVLFVGGSFVSYLPASFLSGMLLMLGLSFMTDWLYDARPKLPASDYALVWIILFVIAAFGFLEGVGVGIALATILFVFKYARIATVRDTLNGEVYHSKVERPARQREVLHEKGRQVHIFRLQGYLFFGTANGILTRVRDILEDKTFHEHFILLDFHRVHSLDSSAVSSFVRMRQLAELHDIYLALTQVSKDIRRQMEQGGFSGDKRVQFFPNLDFGMEWCENMLLMRNEAATEFIATTLKASLKRTFPHPDLVEPLFNYLERVEADVKTVLMRRGDPSDSMYFIESGRLNIQLETPEGEIIRLRSLRGGTVVGEVAMYLNSPRTADVVATQRSALYRLTADALQRMEAEDPATAAALHEWIAKQMAERLAENNNTIEALLD